MGSSSIGVGTAPVVLPGGQQVLLADRRSSAPETRQAADPLAPAYDLPCTLVLEVPVVNFSVGALMQLRAGSIVRTAAQHNEDLALQANGQLVGVAEIDVVGDCLAVRLLGMA